MTAMETYPSTARYFLGVNLGEMTLEERGVLLTGQRLAEVHFDGKLRRDNQPTIGHSRALALKAKELGLSVIAQVWAWGHDLVEDCGVSLEEIGLEFGPYAQRVTFGINALTHREEESVKEYFDRIVEAAKVDFEVAVIKVIDRWHFHLCPYGDPREAGKNQLKEIAKARETLTTFKRMCEQCHQYIPAHFLGIWEELVEEVLKLAVAKLHELGVDVP